MNLVCSLVVTKDPAVVAGPHVKISDWVRSHLAKNHGVIALPAMISPHVMNAHPKKKCKRARHLLHAAKRNLSAVNQSSKSGRISVISHPQRLPDQTSQKVAHYGDPLYLENVTVEKATHPRKVVKVH